MRDELKFLILYLAALNVLALLLYGADKIKAKRKKWRIPENALLMNAWLGGCYGALIGMYLFHHKTRHRAFYLSVPLACVVWTLIIAGALMKLSGTWSAVFGG